MKILIAISSWQNGARKGYNQSQRDTWIQDLKKYHNVDYRFFVGDGKPTGEDEGALHSTFQQVVQGHTQQPEHIKGISVTGFTPQDDEVVLSNVPDDYMHVTFKDKAILRWAYKEWYDFIFICDADTYVDVDKLMHSGFENHDYSGFPFGIFGAEGMGYWLSRKCIPLIVDEPVHVWGADQFIGDVLLKKGVRLHPMWTYREWPLVPRKSNDITTCHLGAPSNLYTADRMYEVHRDNQIPRQEGERFMVYDSPCGHPTHTPAQAGDSPPPQPAPVANTLRQPRRIRRA